MTLSKALRQAELDLGREVRLIGHARMMHDILIVCYESFSDVNVPPTRRLYEQRLDVYVDDDKRTSVIIKSWWSNTDKKSKPTVRTRKSQ